MPSVIQKIKAWSCCTSLILFLLALFIGFVFRLTEIVLETGT